MRRRGAAAAVLAAALATGTACASFTRPEGAGGWSPERRAKLVEESAAAGGVPLGATPLEVSPATPDALPPHDPALAAADPAPLAVREGALDLATALDLAARHNRRVAEAGRELAVAAERVRETRGRLLPTTLAEGRWSFYTDEQTTDVSLPSGLLPAGVPTPVVTTREDDFGTASVVLTLPLDASGELWKSLQAAQAGYRGEAARLWATRLSEAVAVTRSYFQLLEAERLREVATQTLDLDREQLANARGRFDAGRLTKNEVLVVEVAQRNDEQELLRVELGVARARWALNQAVGLPVDAPTRVVDVSAPPVLPAAEEAVRVAALHNPLLAALLEEQQRLEATAASLARGRLPRLAAGGGWEATTSDILEPNDAGSAFVGFTWDLGSDLQREARIAQSRLAAERNRIGIERELREIEQAVRATQRAAEERLHALETARIAVGQADENLRIRRQQFEAGRATSEDVLDAQTLLERQRATLAVALYQAHTRRAELQELMGRPLEELYSAP